MSWPSWIELALAVLGFDLAIFLQHGMFHAVPALHDKQKIEIAAARWALDEQFHDVKEIWGAGQQQVRNIWSNIGCWHLNQWLYTMVEMTYWDIPFEELTDRGGRAPGHLCDNPDFRPSHADRRRHLHHPTNAREIIFARTLADPQPIKKTESAAASPLTRHMICRPGRATTEHTERQ